MEVFYFCLQLTGTETQTTDSSYVTNVFCIIVAAIAVLINISYIIVCFKALKNTFQNLTILVLCFSNTFLAGPTTFTAVLSTGNLGIEFCLFKIFILSYSIFLNFNLIFLLCLQRYLTVRTNNFGIVERFDRKKFYYIGGTVLSSFIFVLCTILLTPHERRISECRGFVLYRKNYPLYATLVFFPITVIIILLVFMSLATGVYLWKVFFANRKVGPSREKNTPRRISSRTELHEFRHTPTHLFLSSSGVNVKSNNGNEKNKHTLTHEFTEQQFHVDADSKNFSFGRKRDGSIKRERNDDNSPDVSSADIFVQVSDTRRHHDNGSQGSKDDIITTTDIKASVENLQTKHPDLNPQKQTPGSSECNMIDLKCYSKTSRNTTIISKTTDSHLRKSWEIQAFITCIIISLHTIICTGPVVCSIWVEVFQGSTVGYQARVITFIFFLTNSLSNPFIYAWRIPEIRQEFRRLFRLNN